MLQSFELIDKKPTNWHVDAYAATLSEVGGKLLRAAGAERFVEVRAGRLKEGVERYVLRSVPLAPYDGMVVRGSGEYWEDSSLLLDWFNDRSPDVMPEPQEGLTRLELRQIRYRQGAAAAELASMIRQARIDNELPFLLNDTSKDV